MSIRNQVTADFANIAIYDNSGNVYGLQIQSNINSNGNVGAFVIGHDLTSNTKITSIGNGNIYTNQNLTVGNSATILGNTVSTGPLNGTFTVTSNSADYRSSTSLANGVIRTGGNIYANGSALYLYGGGAGSYTPNSNVSLFAQSSGPIIDLNGGYGYYSGLQLDTNGFQDWFAGKNDTGNFVVRSTGSQDNLTLVQGSNSSVTIDSNVSVIANSILSLQSTGNTTLSAPFLNLNSSSSLNINSTATPNYFSGTGLHDFNWQPARMAVMTRLYNSILSTTLANNAVVYPGIFFDHGTATEAQMGLQQDTSGGGPFAVWINQTVAPMWLLVTASIGFAANSVGMRTISIGSTDNTDQGIVYGRTRVAATNNTNTVSLSTSAMIFLDGTTNFEFGVRVVQNSGGNLTVGGSQLQAFQVGITRLG